ncbi:hypothetical protein KAR91_84600 [Candidatus Pacearchaeota archaeon]|nr:hypothetical protein [Candidatus Pacearchaeota archaeon]
MPNELSAAINTIATLASLTTEVTYANSAVKINWPQSSQTTREAMIKSFIEYGDHISYVSPSDGKLWLIDTLTGITPAIDIENFEIKGVSGQNQGKIIGKIVADLTIAEFNNGGINGSPSLKDIPIQLSLATNQPSQDEYKIKVSSQPTTLSSGSVIYNYTDVNAVLTRKKSMYESKIITIVYNGIFDLQIGQRIDFDNTHDEDIHGSLTGSGSMTVTSRSFDMSKMKMTISGIGSFSES